MAKKNVAIVTNTDKFIVAQSNDLIEANYPTSMTARAHKTARLVLALISPNDKDLRTYTITIDALQRYLGMSTGTKWGAFYKELRHIQDKLNEQPIEIKKPNGGYIRTPFLGLDISPKEGTVTFEISGLLKPYLLELKKNYTSYLLAHIPKLKSGYSIRIYELLHQYRKIGKRYFELDDLQKKVGSSYNDKYNNFKRRVLLQAQKDLKKHTDLAFVFHERKDGRKVSGIQFVIFGNTPEKEKPVQLNFLENAIEVNEKTEKPALSELIVKALNNLGISEQNIAKYLAQEFDIITDEKTKESVKLRCKTLESYYLEKLELTKNSASSDNAAGFLIKALQEDWSTSKTKHELSKKEAVRSRAINQKKIRALQSRIDKLTKQKDAVKKPIIEKLLSDDVTFKKAYDAAINGLGEFMRSHVSSVKHLPIREQYQNQMTIKQSVNVEILNAYPKSFVPVQKIEEQIKATQKEIETLK